MPQERYEEKTPMNSYDVLKCSQATAPPPPGDAVADGLQVVAFKLGRNLTPLNSLPDVA